VLLAREFVALAAQNHDQRARHLDETRRRFAAGTVTEYDILAAAVAEQNARPEMIRTANRLSDARERLAFVLGIQGRAVDVTGSLDTTAPPVPDHAAAFWTAATNRPSWPSCAELRHVRGDWSASPGRRTSRAWISARTSAGGPSRWTAGQATATSGTPGCA
jgi:HAE1 family hydrophobic/amphiphilic exporter-1